MSQEHGKDVGATGVHIAPHSMYYAVFGSLMVLTVITVWVSFLDLGWANDIVALGVAFTKASLVVLFFMHVKYQGRFVKLLVCCGLIWMFIMFGLTMSDYSSRGWVTADPEDIGSSFE